MSCRVPGHRRSAARRPCPGDPLCRAATGLGGRRRRCAACRRCRGDRAPLPLPEKTLRKILPPMGLMRACNARNVRPQGQSVMRTQFPASPDDIDLAALGAAVKRALPKLLVATLVVGLASFVALSMLTPKY